MTHPWMLYGATGYTGQLLAEEAVSRNQRPLLAGRNPEALKALGERLGLPWVAVSLEDTEGLLKAVQSVKAVLHAAGPFLETSAPMVEACLAAKVHYLDITGEWPVFEALYARHEEAVQRGVVLLPGVGFDVVPTDCLAAWVAAQCPNAQSLTLAVAAIGSPSSGTAKSALGIVTQGSFVVEGGKRKRIPLTSKVQRFSFPFGETMAVAAPLADNLSAHRSTGIPNVACYAVLPSKMLRPLQFAWPLVEGFRALARPAMQSAFLQRRLRAFLTRRVQGPTPTRRKEERSYVWAKAEGKEGSFTALLETLEGYTLTAIAGVSAVEKVLAENPQGAQTPSQALGADFVLTLPQTRRVALPEAQAS